MKPTTQEIYLTLKLYNADHKPEERVLFEHWSSWWDEPIPRAIMSRYLEMVRASGAVHLAASLDRQCDNMVFVVNHATLGTWYDKFKGEVELDQEVLRASGLRP